MQIPKRSATPPMPPAGVRQWLERTPQGNDALESAVRQLATAYEKVHTQTDRIMADQTVNRNARTVRAAKAARATLSPAVRALESARGEAAKARDFLTRKINEPFQTSDRLIGDLLLDGQIRQHFAGLPSDQRIAALRNALDSRDAVTLRALTSAPAYLSGLADPLYETARNVLIQDHAPNEARALQSLDETAAFADKVESTLLQSTADLIDFQAADSFAAAAAEAVA